MQPKKNNPAIRQIACPGSYYCSTEIESNAKEWETTCTSVGPITGKKIKRYPSLKNYPTNVKTGTCDGRKVASTLAVSDWTSVGGFREDQDRKKNQTKGLDGKEIRGYFIGSEHRFADVLFWWFPHSCRFSFSLIPLWLSPHAQAK